MKRRDFIAFLAGAAAWPLRLTNQGVGMQPLSDRRFAALALSR
jgi:hypothetical protein